MSIEKIYAQLCCKSLEHSMDWFEKLFDRPCDEQPMAGLAEWHFAPNAGLQLFENETKAGQGTLTLIVDGLRGEASRLRESGIDVPEIEPADTTSLLRLFDPDGNLVVLAQPGRA